MADKTNIDHHTPSSSSAPQLTSTKSDSNTTCKTTKRELGKDSACRETKRKKNCPAALDKIQKVGDFSFSFDTKFSVSAPEFTPKFGSFNSELGLKLKEEEDEREDGCFRSREEAKNMITKKVKKFVKKIDIF